MKKLHEYEDHEQGAKQKRVDAMRWELAMREDEGPIDGTSLRKRRAIQESLENRGSH